MRPRLASRTLWRMPAQLRQSGGASLPARMVSRTIRPLPRQRDLEIFDTTRKRFVFRHGRARPGHPRLPSRQEKKDVDARHKAGHDGWISKNIMLNQRDEIMIRSNLVGT